jgi:hypothetical protein
MLELLGGSKNHTAEHFANPATALSMIDRGTLVDSLSLDSGKTFIEDVTCTSKEELFPNMMGD